MGEASWSQTFSNFDLASFAVDRTKVYTSGRLLVDASRGTLYTFSVKLSNILVHY